MNSISLKVPGIRSFYTERPLTEEYYKVRKLTDDFWKMTGIPVVFDGLQ